MTLHWKEKGKKLLQSEEVLLLQTGKKIKYQFLLLW